MFYITFLIALLIFLISRVSKIAGNRTSYNILDFGFLISIILGLYTILPSLTYLFFKDNLIFLGQRINSLDPTNSEVSYLLLVSISLILGIFISYKFSSSNYNFELQDVKFIDNRVFKNSIGLLAISTLLITLIKIQYGLYSVESYASSYTSFWKIPDIVRQFYLLFQGAQEFSKIIILIGVFQRTFINKKLFIIIIFAYLLISFDSSGARAGLFINFLLIFSLYQFFIKKFSKTKMLLFSLIGLFVFSLFGVLRGGLNTGNILLSSILVVGEFMTIWANALHILQLKSDGLLSMPYNVWINEFIAFIPSQFLPFEKMSPSVWYMDTFYYEALQSGNGLGFGIITQSISDGGLFFAFLRGFILGKISLMFKKAVLKSNKWWVFPVYLVMFLGLYSTVRSSTFSTFTNPVIQLFLFIFLISLTIRPKK
ncbi:oligosaccharide repeat unit polymerase [Flavobacteriaceae bacterium]|nr:oligosaccharide repeat unit polymerase [Flavobacteriaceae bacterium]